MDSTLLKVQMHFTPFGRGKFLPQCMWPFIKNGKISFGKCHEFPKRKKDRVTPPRTPNPAICCKLLQGVFFSMRIRRFEGHKSLMPYRNPLKQFAHSVFLNFLVQLKITMYFMRKRFQLGFVTLSSKVYHEYKWRLSTFGFWMLDFDCWL